MGCVDPVLSSSPCLEAMFRNDFGEIAPLLELGLGFVDTQVVIIVTLVRLVKVCFSQDAPSIECEGVLVLPVELLVLAIRICTTSPRTCGPGERRNAAPSPGFLSQK